MSDIGDWASPELRHQACVGQLGQCDQQGESGESAKSSLNTGKSRSRNSWKRGWADADAAAAVVDAMQAETGEENEE